MDQTIVLMEAARNNDTTILEAELANLSETDDREWLLVASKNNSVNFVKVVMASMPSLARWKNKKGQSAIHIACENGRVRILKALLESTPDGADHLCLMRDQNGMIPLHIATMKGGIQVMKTLLKACPQSLAEVTSFYNESALHLAAKFDQNNAFEVLLEETLKRGQEKILHLKDYEGNNVLHIATVHKQIENIKRLLVDNLKGGPLVQVNSMNKKKFTAMDLHMGRDEFYDCNDRAIAILLRDAGARERQSSHSKSTKSLLAFFSLIAFTIFANIYNLDCITTSAAVKPQSVGDILQHPDLLPAVFYNIVFSTFVFMACMVMILVLLWPLIKKYSFRQRALCLFILAGVFLTYASIMKEKVPKFQGTVKSFKISSFSLVLLCCLFSISFLAIIELVELLIRRNQDEDV